MKGGILMSKVIVNCKRVDKIGCVKKDMYYCDKSDLSNLNVYSSKEYKRLVSRVWKRLKMIGYRCLVSMESKEIIEVNNETKTTIHTLCVYDKKQEKERDLTVEELKVIDEHLAVIEEAYQKFVESQQEYRSKFDETMSAMYSSLNIL